MTRKKTRRTLILDLDNIHNEERENDLVTDWLAQVKRDHRSRKTVATYAAGVRQFAAWLRGHKRPLWIEDVTREDVQRWVNDMADGGRRPATIAIYLRAVKLLIGFAIDEGLIAADESPTNRIRQPEVKPPEVAVLSPEQIASLRRASSGRGFFDRRNRALILLFLDTGLRRGEMVSLTVDDVTLLPDDPAVGGILNVRVSKTDPRPVVFGREAGDALAAYLRARKHRGAAKRSDALWLGQQTALCGETLRLVVKRLGREAGIPDLHPHTFRHTATHLRLEEGDMTEGEIAAMMGWRSRKMLDRYGASKRHERAVAARMNALRARAAA